MARSNMLEEMGAEYPTAAIEDQAVQLPTEEGPYEFSPGLNFGLRTVEERTAQRRCTYLFPARRGRGAILPRFAVFWVGSENRFKEAYRG